MSTKSTAVDGERLLQAVRSHLGRIRGCEDLRVRDAARQLERETERALKREINKNQ